MMDFIKKFFGFYDLLEIMKIQKIIINKQDQLIETHRRLDESNERMLKIQENSISKRDEVIALQRSLIDKLENKNQSVAE